MALGLEVSACVHNNQGSDSLPNVWLKDEEKHTQVYTMPKHTPCKAFLLDLPFLIWMVWLKE